MRSIVPLLAVLCVGCVHCDEPIVEDFLGKFIGNYGGNAADELASGHGTGASGSIQNIGKYGSLTLLV